MIAELGHFALVLSLGLALCLTLMPAIGVARNNVVLMQMSGSLAAGQFVFCLFAFGCLAHAFLTDDFSVAYVANNSNTLLPVYYKFSAIWGAHEGSFLLWTLVMAGWTLAVAIYSRALPLNMLARVMSVLGFLMVGFLMFMLFTSNPFDRNLPVFPQEGSDLNPLLQDFGLIVHPPMLYMGYVGFAVPFAFAIATLSAGQLDAAWARWSRPWTNVAWAFLTVGITLGSWWAYYELGWGGWWFWDAVENASFMPWLIGTALIHSLAATEKRGVFKSWTVLLAIFAFSFSLLGAFLVRSGVLTSVHAFAVDPERGSFILAFLVVVVGGSLLLYAVKAATVRSEVEFEPSGRETLLLANNVILVVSVAAVLLGTIYPLIYESFTGGDKISVGPPYFDAVFVPLMLVLFVFMAVSPGSRWRSTPMDRLVVQQWKPLAASLAVTLGIAFIAADTIDWVTVGICWLALWIAANLLIEARDRVRNKPNPVLALFRQTPSWYGMWLAHFGIVLSILGVAITVAYSVERDVRMEKGDVVSLSGYNFRFEGTSRVEGPNYVADEGLIVVSRGGDEIARLMPQKRLYKSGGNVMTEADMDVGLFRDLFVALGEPVGESAWAVRVHYKPFVRWIWYGGVFVMLGGLVTVFDRRYRTARRKATAPASAEAAPA